MMYFILGIVRECAFILINYKVFNEKWCKNYTITNFTII